MKYYQLYSDSTKPIIWIPTVDGSEILRCSPVEVGSLSHYLQGFVYARWCRISEPSTVLTNQCGGRVVTRPLRSSGNKNGNFCEILGANLSNSTLANLGCFVPST